MKKIINQLYTRKWLSAILITTILFVFLLALFPEHYETGDDFWINSIASGLTTERDYHLVFNNVLLGHLLVFLNTVASSVPWYGLFQYIIAFLSLSSVICLLLKKGNTACIFSVFLFVPFFCYELLIKAEFTKVSGVAAASGILLVLFALEQTPLPKCELIIGLILLFVSSLYRIAGFLGALSVWIVYGIIRLIQLIREKNTAILKRYLIVIPAMLLLCISIWGIDYLSYQSNDGWKSYKEFLTTEKKLNDFSYPEYSSNPDAYEKADVNENARTMYSHMDIADPEKYTIPVIDTIAEAKPVLALSPQTFARFLKESLPSWFRDYPYVYGVIGLFIIALLIQKGRRRQAAGLFIGTVLIFVMTEYALFLRGRYGLNRVDMILIYSLGTVALLSILRSDTPKIASPSSSGRKGILLQAAVVPICLLTGLLLYHFQAPHIHGVDIEASDVEAKKPQKTFYALLDADQENTYLISWAVSDYSMCFGPLDPIGYRSADNQIYLGGWLIESPLYHEQLSERNIENPFRSLVSDPDVYLLQNGVYIENTLTYLNDYYGSMVSDPPYYGVLVKNIGGNLVYKITTDDLTRENLSFDLSELPSGDEILTNYTEVHPNGQTADISGSLYLDGENSFSEQLYLILENKETKETCPFYLTQGENPFAGDLMHGQYSAFAGTFPYEGSLDQYNIWLIYRNGDSLYKFRVKEDRIL